MANTSLLKVLNQEEVQKIHEGSVEILKETGIVFQSKEVLDIFKEHGAKVDGNKVYISEEIINESLSTTPENFKLWARDESKSIIIGKGSESLAIQPNIGPIYIQDIKHGKRDSTLKDLINIFKLCQESDIVNLIGATPVEPNDIKNDEKHLQIMYNLLKHTDKALASIARERKRIREMFDMIEIAVGDKKVLEDEYFILVGVCPASPLRFEKIPSETILEYAKRAQPIKIVPSIMSGVSGPIGLFGTAILQNAEMLAGLVLIQMINPGNPVIFMPGSTVADMRTGAYLTGSPEGTLINIGNIQLCKDLYNIPSAAMVSITDAKIVDYQAGLETMQNVLMLLAAGVDHVSESLGILDSYMTTSYEKIIIDLEILSRVERIMQGIDTSTYEDDIKAIKEMGPGGVFLTHPDTLKSFKNRWRPTISCWDSYNDWKKKGSLSIEEEANKKYKEILKKSPESLIDDKTDKELKKYMDDILENN